MSDEDLTAHQQEFKGILEREGLRGVVFNIQERFEKFKMTYMIIFWASVVLVLLFIGGASIAGLYTLFAGPDSEHYKEKRYEGWEIISGLGTLYSIVGIILVVFYCRDYWKKNECVDAAIELSGAMSDIYSRKGTNALLHSSMARLMTPNESVTEALRQHFRGHGRVDDSIERSFFGKGTELPPTEEEPPSLPLAGI